MNLGRELERGKCYTQIIDIKSVNPKGAPQCSYWFTAKIVFAQPFTLIFRSCLPKSAKTFFFYSFKGLISGSLRHTLSNLKWLYIPCKSGGVKESAMLLSNVLLIRAPVNKNLHLIGILAFLNGSMKLLLASKSYLMAMFMNFWIEIV